MEKIANELLEFFKALADATRLKIVGLLAQGEYSVEQLAEILGVRSSTVSHHLTKLSKSGLVSARSESYYNIYRLETQVLEEMSKKILARDIIPAVTADMDMDAYDRKVINTFCNPDGSIRQFPAQSNKKFEAILRHVVKGFEPGVRYPEKQVNEILLRYNVDTAILRRGLIAYKMMAREGGGGVYWLVENPE